MTIWEEKTYVDHAFDIWTGNVERQTETSVVPNGRSDQNTKRETESLTSSQHAENPKKD